MMSSTIRSTMKMAVRRPSWVIWLSSQHGAQGRSPRVKNRFSTAGEGHDDTSMGFRPRVRDRTGTRETTMHRASSAATMRVGHQLPGRMNRATMYRITARSLVRGSSRWTKVLPGKILAQGDILSAYARLPSYARAAACSSSSTV